MEPRNYKRDVINHLIENHKRYKWRFDIHTNSFEMFVDNTQYILKNYSTKRYEHDIVFVVKGKKYYLLVKEEDEPLVSTLWSKVFGMNVSTMWDSDWREVCEELLEPKVKL